MICCRIRSLNAYTVLKGDWVFFYIRFLYIHHIHFAPKIQLSVLEIVLLFIRQLFQRETNEWIVKESRNKRIEISSSS